MELIKCSKPGTVVSAKRVSCIVGGLLLLLQTSPSYSATADERAKAERLQQRAIERLRNEESRFDTDEPIEGFDVEGIIPPKPESSQADKDACKQIDKISFLGAKLLRSEEKQRLTEPYVGKCFSVSDLETLLTEVTTHYFRQGYITTRAYLPNQNVQEKSLEILVVEGLIEGFDLSDDASKFLKLEYLSPVLAGDKLNIRDIEQIVDNANGLGRGKVSFDIEPGSFPGKSVVKLKTEDPQRVSGSLSTDNQGSESTGKNNFSLNLSSANLLGKNESWSVVHRSSMPNDRNAGSDNTSLNIKFPMGHGQLEVKAARSQFSTSTETDLGRTLVFSGHTDTIDLAYGRTIYRNQKDLHKLRLQLGVAENQSYVDETLLGVSSKRLVRMTLDYNVMLRRPSGTFNLKPSLVMGLTKLNNLPDNVNLPADGDQSEFSQFKFFGSYQKPFSIKASSFRWDSKLNAQFEHDELFSSEQILVGSSSSVRGFKDNSLSSSRGAYWQNELSWLYNKNTSWGKMKLRPYIALDIGRVHSRFDDEQSGVLAGSALGLNLDIGKLALEFSVAKGIDSLSDLPSEGTLSEGRLSYRF